jgi:hypothetical protein
MLKPCICGNLDSRSIQVKTSTALKVFLNGR